MIVTTVHNGQFHTSEVRFKKTSINNPITIHFYVNDNADDEIALSINMIERVGESVIELHISDYEVIH